jgi:hypothetical protein
MTAASGNPAADAARTYMLLKDAVIPGDMPKVLRAMINLVRRRMAKKYLRNYQKLSGITKKEIEKWRLPIIAARLMEWVPDSEKKSILKEISRIPSLRNTEEEAETI